MNPGNQQLRIFDSAKLVELCSPYFVKITFRNYRCQDFVSVGIYAKLTLLEYFQLFHYYKSRLIYSCLKASSWNCLQIFVLIITYCFRLIKCEPLFMFTIIRVLKCQVNHILILLHFLNNQTDKSFRKF